MYIIAIGWLYVTLLMAFTEVNLVAAVLTFVFYGVLPVSILMWLLGSPMRRRKRAAQEMAEQKAAEQAAAPTAQSALANQVPRQGNTEHTEGN